MPDNTQYIYNKLIAGGVTPIGAMGLIGGWKNESGQNLDPNAQNPGGAFGIAQWNDRKPALLSYLKQNGYATNDLDGQISYALKELHGSENKTLLALNSATNIRDAARAAVGYERPEGWKANNPEAAYDFSKRLASAQQVQGLLGSSNGGDSYGASSAPVQGTGSRPVPVAPPTAAPTPNTPAVDPTAVGANVGLLGALGAGGPAPQQQSTTPGLDMMAKAMAPASTIDQPQMPQDPGIMRLQQQRQAAMAAAQKFLPPPPGMTGLLG